MPKTKILEFAPEQFEITESKTEGDSGKLHLAGTALVEGTSRNKINYVYENLAENNNREFKWIVGHPDQPNADDMVGKGVLTLEGTKLKHNGWVMNTARYPDIMKKVQEGILGPSIHAGYDSITKKDTKEGTVWNVKGLRIEGVSLVPFQGVPQANIERAVAEAYVPEKNEPKVEEEEQVEENQMAEEELKQLKEENEALKNQLKAAESARKEEIVSQIVSVNESLKKEELMEQDEKSLKMVLEYEQKLAKKAEEEASAKKKAEEEVSAGDARVDEEEDQEEEDKLEEGFEDNKGNLTLTKKAREAFNKAISEKIPSLK